MHHWAYFLVWTKVIFLVESKTNLIHMVIMVKNHYEILYPLSELILTCCTSTQDITPCQVFTILFWNCCASITSYACWHLPFFCFFSAFWRVCFDFLFLSFIYLVEDPFMLHPKVFMPFFNLLYFSFYYFFIWLFSKSYTDLVVSHTLFVGTLGASKRSFMVLECIAFESFS